MYRIGVDVGGTNTDGVLIDISRRSSISRGILASFKAPTTPDVSSGIEAAVKRVLQQSGVPPSEISSLSIGTTAFINAVLEADPRRLQKVAVIRLCGPYTKQCPPFIDFPKRLKTLIDGHVGYVDGGLEIDGREIAPLREQQIIDECNIIKTKGLRNIVVAGIFSPLDTTGRQELSAKRIIQQELGTSVNIVCSRDVGQLGLLERENASILNASILTFAQQTIRGFQRAMETLNLKCPLFLTQNDGTLTTASAAAQLPIRTFASGPTNSMRGAAYLAGLDDHHDQTVSTKSTIVVDVGGTTTDVGVLLPSGFPRQAAAFIEVGGVRTNFSMADVQSIALGGGSRVRIADDSKVTVGPDSVGHRLPQDAKIFGGTVLTATDIVVASGLADVGKKEYVNDIDEHVKTAAEKVIRRHLESIIDKMKTSPEDISVLLVGGGSIIAPEHLSGVGEIIRPPFFGVANAVGAAMAKVAGEIDVIEFLQGRKVEDVIEGIKIRAIEKAISAGAAADTVKIVEVNNLPVQYVTNQATRIIVRAAGELGNSIETLSGGLETLKLISEDDSTGGDSLDPVTSEGVDQEDDGIDIEAYIPNIREDKSWKISELDLEWIAEGCGVLGTGGGGSPYPPFLVARQMLRNGKEIIVVDPEDVPENSVFLRCTFMGSPSVSNERLQGGNEIPTSARAIMQYLGLDDQNVLGTISDEIGGGNGIQPMIVAAEMHKVVLDADLMGRAYPNILPGAYDIPGGLTPCAISDGIGNTIIMPSASNTHSVEHILRTVTTEMGSRSGVSMAPLTRKICQDYGISRSVSQAWRIGRAIALCRKRNTLKSIPAAILQIQNGSWLFIGKIVNVEREVRKGFTWGVVTIVPLRADEEEDGPESTNGFTEQTVACGPDDRLLIPFQNENLYAYLENPNGTKRILVTVPDLITVLDSQSGASLGTPDYRYGLRVTVIAMAGDPKWTKTPEGLACGGPGAFGLSDLAFTPIAEYKAANSVIKEYCNL
ncbi:DUF917-domain-containing protein [Abortiporus biennis]|nr:DUF917-domain-containing protein [Abortiporus biennis]